MNWIEQIEDLKNLKDDWNSYGAKAPNEIARENAKKYTQKLLDNGATCVRVAPTSDDSVMVNFNTRKGMLTFDFYEDGGIAVMVRLFYDNEINKEIFEQIVENPHVLELQNNSKNR